MANNDINKHFIMRAEPTHRTIFFYNSNKVYFILILNGDYVMVHIVLKTNNLYIM